MNDEHIEFIVRQMMQKLVVFVELVSKTRNEATFTEWFHWVKVV